MDTLKIITTLWSIAIPSTILFVLIQLLHYNKEPQKDKSILEHSVLTLSNVFTFITFFSWMSIVFLTLSDGLLSSFILSSLLSLLLVGLFNVIISPAEKVKKTKKASKDYIKQVKAHSLEVVREDRSMIAS